MCRKLHPPTSSHLGPDLLMARSPPPVSLHSPTPSRSLDPIMPPRLRANLRRPLLLRHPPSSIPCWSRDISSTAGVPKAGISSTRRAATAQRYFAGSLVAHLPWSKTTATATLPLCVRALGGGMAMRRIWQRRLPPGDKGGPLRQRPCLNQHPTSRYKLITSASPHPHH